MSSKNIYRFTDTNINELKEISGTSLEFEDLVNLIQKISYVMQRSNKTDYVTISKYTKDERLIHESKLELPLPESTSFDVTLEPFMAKKPLKIKQQSTNKESKSKTPFKLSLKKILANPKMKRALIIASSLIILLFLGSGVLVASAIHTDSQTRLKESREQTISKLENEKKYDTVAEKMKQYGYSKKAISDMYISHDKFQKAIDTDRNSLERVLTKIHTLDSNDQKTSLMAVLNSNKLKLEQEKEVKMYLAIVYQDGNYIKGHVADINNAKLSRFIVRYLIGKGDYDTAKAVLKRYPNSSLSSDLKTALKSQLANKKQQIADLQKQLDDINKSNDKDKDKNKESKQKEIDTAIDEKTALESDIQAIK